MSAADVDIDRAMNFGEFADGTPQQPLPELLSSREADLFAFQNYCKNMMLRILTLFALGLNVGTPTILGCSSKSTQFVSYIFRSILTRAEETGLLPATKADPAVALFASSNTPPSPVKAASTPQSTSEPEHTPTTVP